jgi:hypothetical protein
MGYEGLTSSLDLLRANRSLEVFRFVDASLKATGLERLANTARLDEKIRASQVMLTIVLPDFDEAITNFIPLCKKVSDIGNLKKTALAIARTVPRQHRQEIMNNGLQLYL